jgi:uncharacterized surface protein with fasciclin (FAS1) repeats
MKKKLLVALIAALAVGITVAPTAASAKDNNGGTFAAKKKAAICKEINNQQRNTFSNYYNQNNRFQNGWLQFLTNAENRRNCPVTLNTVETLVQNGNFKTLVAAAGAAGLADTLATQELTVFAPTDQAFKKLPAGTVEALLADIPTLTSILTYHVVGGEVPFSTAKKLSSAPTVNGADVNISFKAGSLFINDSRVVIYDIQTTNGVIHVIDTVLIP